MSSSHALVSEQPLHHSTFADLQLKISSQSIVARLLQYWDSPNIDNPSESMGITLLFLDEKGSMINRFIPANQAGDYRSSLQEGDIFEVANFEVERCPHMYKVKEHTFVIRFIAQTTFVKFISKDVVGQIQSVKGYGLTNPQVISPLLISFFIEPGYSPLRHGGHDGQPNKNWRLRTTVGEEFPSSHDKTWINDQQVSSIGDLNMFLSNTTDQTENLLPHMPWVLKRVVTSDGRLILREEKVRHHEYFRAHRSNGRLTLHLVPLDDDVFELPQEPSHYPPDDVDEHDHECDGDDVDYHYEVRDDLDDLADNVDKNVIITIRDDEDGVVRNYDDVKDNVHGGSDEEYRKATLSAVLEETAVESGGMVGGGGGSPRGKCLKSCFVGIRAQEIRPVLS
ncbi:hypothetical protein DY000_02046147 [Brassica cretica]|uniref:DUF223 domain-containing protein n=1 Tax=Brassica cretica TaxID=69181 RepID=A0ABQ7EN78_BRACR|nr:hypothetical protein DY000_02046147 [Brassica cretica]